MVGRSVVGLISGGACTIPAIMSTRSINNQRDRLVTMFCNSFDPLLSSNSGLYSFDWFCCAV